MRVILLIHFSLENDFSIGTYYKGLMALVTCTYIVKRVQMIEKTFFIIKNFQEKNMVPIFNVVQKSEFN